MAFQNQNSTPQLGLRLISATQKFQDCIDSNNLPFPASTSCIQGLFFSELAPLKHPNLCSYLDLIKGHRGNDLHLQIT
jgi:hypothetical protein